jgi:hypothetical protein
MKKKNTIKARKASAGSRIIASLQAAVGWVFAIFVGQVGNLRRIGNPPSAEGPRRSWLFTAIDLNGDDVVAQVVAPPLEW